MVPVTMSMSVIFPWGRASGSNGLGIGVLIGSFSGGILSATVYGVALLITFFRLGFTGPVATGLDFASAALVRTAVTPGGILPLPKED